MRAAARATALLLDPAAEWMRIEKETGDPAYLLSRYAGVLALVPALFGFVGACIIGALDRGGTVRRMAVADGVFAAIFGYVATIVIVFAVGVAINVLAPYFGARRDFESACKLAVYSYTPVWLAGIFLLLPGLHFLLLTGFYGGYLLGRGLPRLMHAPEPQAQAYIAAIVASAGVLTVIAIAAQRAVFGLPGL
jgi:hypothetical protein